MPIITPDELEQLEPAAAEAIRQMETMPEDVPAPEDTSSSSATITTIEEEIRAMEEKQIKMLTAIFRYADYHDIVLQDLAEQQGIHCFFNDNSVAVMDFMELQDPITGKQFKDFSLEELTAEPESTEQIPKIERINITELSYPIDKINSNIWYGLTEDMRSEDGAFHFNTKGKQDKSEQEVSLTFNVDTTNLEQQLNLIIKDISELPTLSPRVKRVMIAANALYNNTESHIFTITQLYHAMGYKGNPGPKDIEAIKEDLDYLQYTNITVNNIKEIAARYNVEEFGYEGPIMVSRRFPLKKNGKTVIAIQMAWPPSLMEFAQGRKQTTLIPQEVFALPISNTEKNAQIHDYLLRRIIAIKKGRLSNKILYTSVFRNCKIENKMDKSRTKTKINTILSDFVKNEFIISYSVSEKKDGVFIEY